MSITIGAGKWQVNPKDAKLAVAGYAFGTREITGPSGSEQAPRWGYRTYDCIAASAGQEFSHLDILVAAGLNGRLDVASVGRCSWRSSMQPRLWPRPPAWERSSPACHPRSWPTTRPQARRAGP